MSTNGNWLARSAATTVPGSVVLIGRGLSLRRHSEVAGPETLGTGRFDKADISAADSLQHSTEYSKSAAVH
ncbi:hypothetical protein ACIBJI_30515 [Nocardia sp. NPDC050408]|uniref:hypothetical protein n=1 Tax=unclassified Nocardia TaxID=2637762 RepID=UPI00341B7CDD